MQQEQRQPKPRGGRRPGAGAPVGNQNAFIHGLRARHVAYNAAGLLVLVPAYRERLIATRFNPTPEGRRERKRLLDAAIYVIENHPELTYELRALIRQGIEGRYHEFPLGRSLLDAVSTYPDGRHDPLTRTIGHAWHVIEHDPDPELPRQLIEYITIDVEDALNYLEALAGEEKTRKPIKQSKPRP